MEQTDGQKRAAILDGLGEGVLLLAADGRILFANAASHAQLGIDPTGTRIEGPNPLLSADGSRVPRAEWPAVRALAGEAAPPPLTLGVPRGDGEISWLRITARRIDRGGEAVVVVTMVDLGAERDASERLRALLDAVDVHTYAGTLQPDGTYAESYTGPGESGLLGTAPGSTDGDWDAAVHPDDREIYTRSHDLLLLTGRWDITYRLVGQDGVTRWVQDRARRRPGAEDGLVELDGVVWDVTEQREQAILAQEREDEQAVLGGLARLVAEGVDPRTLMERVATEAAAWLRADEALVARFQEPHDARVLGSWRVRGVPHAPAGTVVALADDEALRGVRGAVAPIRVHAYRPPGAAGAATGSAVAAPITIAGNVWGAVVVHAATRAFSGADAARLARLVELVELAIANADARDRLARHATTDALTGIANRRAFEERLALEADRAHRAGAPQLSLVLLDIDHFKRLNDTFGHPAGDRVLAHLAGLLGSIARDHDMVARVGGEEFAWLMMGADEGAAEAGAHRLLEVLRGSRVPVAGSATVSAGVATLGPSDLPAELYQRADAALYAAKRAGRDRVRAFSALSEQDFKALEPEPVRIAQVLILAASVGAREGLMPLHNERVAELASETAAALELPPGVVLRCRVAGLLHDVGKLSIPDAILRKRVLDHEEQLTLRSHVETGADLVARIADTAECAPAIRHHHERWDGGGYPDGLAGTAIPIEARILAAAETFVLVAEGRESGRDSDHDSAIAELRRRAGTELDVACVEATVGVLEARRARFAAALAAHHAAD